MPTTTRPRPIFGMLDGYRPITNLLGAGDPNVHWIDGRWWMFFGGFQRTFRNNLFSATLPEGARLDESQDWSIRTDPARPTTAQPLVEQPPKGAWDHYGLHEPCFVDGPRTTPDGERVACQRIYYTGRSSRSTLGNDSPFAIGFLERTPDGWRRHPDPVVVGDSTNPSALGPKVVYEHGKWRMWFRATPGEPAKGQLPVAEIRYTESDDGVRGWSPPRPFHPRERSFAHAHVRGSAEGYEMLLSTSPNLFGEFHYPPQGLWLSTSGAPSGDVADWSPPERVLDTGSGPVWLRNGIFGAAMCADDGPENDQVRHVFLTGVHETVNWPTYALRRLVSFRRPPVPSPFYFTIGHLTLDLTAGRHS